MNGAKSLVLVTVDCLRADHVGFMGYERPTTPFLDQLAGESIVFETAIAAGSPTYYSFPAILASRYPLALGREVVGIAPGETTLASTLREAGYATAAFSAANPYLSRRCGFDQGFATFSDGLTGKADSENGNSVSAARNSWATRANRALDRASHKLGPLGAFYDEIYFQYCQRLQPAPVSLELLRRFPAADALVDEAAAWLSKVQSRPFFLWLHFMDPHAPYYPTDEGQTLLGFEPVTPFHARYLNSYWNRSGLGTRRLSRRREEIVRLYDGGIRWVDEQLSRLVRVLRGTNSWQDCVFAVTADHGEEFLDHGGRFHSTSRLTEERIHVPLLLRDPEITAARARSVFSLLHLAPTLLGAMNVDVPSSFQGKNCWSDLKKQVMSNQPAIVECVKDCNNPLQPENRMGWRLLAVRDDRYKLTVAFDQQRDELYDLEADPREQSPLPGSAEPAIRRRLLLLARDHLRGGIRNRNAPAALRLRLRELRLQWAHSASSESK